MLMEWETFLFILFHLVDNDSNVLLHVGSRVTWVLGLTGEIPDEFFLFIRFFLSLRCE